MEPFDPLDRLLRGDRARSPLDRLQAAFGRHRARDDGAATTGRSDGGGGGGGGTGAGGDAVRRRAWVVGVVAVASLAIVLVLVRGHAAGSGTVELPRAGSTPAGSTVAPDLAGGPAPPASSATTTAPAAGLVVHVAGAVVRPGLVTVAGGGRVSDAVDAAGGLRPDADVDRLNLAAPLVDGTRVYVPRVGQLDPPPAVTVPGAPGPAAGAGDPSATAGPVDVNTADAAALDELPGVGPSTAAAIVAYRTANGPFGSVDDLQDVRGIGPAKLDALRDLVTVGR